MNFAWGMSCVRQDSFYVGTCGKSGPLVHCSLIAQFAQSVCTGGLDCTLEGGETLQEQ